MKKILLITLPFIIAGSFLSCEQINKTTDKIVEEASGKRASRQYKKAKQKARDIQKKASNRYKNYEKIEEKNYESR